MSEFDAYCHSILCHASIGMWMWDMAKQFVQVLYDDNVLIDKIWSSIVHGATYVEMRALVFENDNDSLEAVARWERDKAKVSDPLSVQWNLMDVKIDHPVRGLVY